MPFAGRTVATFALAVALVLPADASGQATARAFLTPGSEVNVGETFIVSVEVSQGGSMEQDPSPPDLSGWAQYLGSGSSRSVTIVNGRSTVTEAIQFRYRANREGAFGVPSVSVQADGRTLRTDPLTVTVRPRGQAPSRGTPTAQDAGFSGDDIFVTAEVARTRVREGEPLVVAYRIWTRVNVTSYTLTGVPEMEGFWVEEIPSSGSPQVEQRTRGGQQYTSAVLRRVVVVPTGSGQRTLEPLKIDAQVRVRRRGGDPFDRIFGGGLFGTSLESVTVESRPVTINVEPLPPGRPEPFSGVVGDLVVRSELDQTTVNTNDAVTLTVHVSGSGSIRTVPQPEIDLPEAFEIFPPETSDMIRASSRGIAGTKTFEFVLIPRAPGQYTIPAIRYGYFDERSDGYRTAEAPAIAVSVTGTAADGPGSGRGGVTELRQDIRFIHLGIPTLRPTSSGLARDVVFWLVLLLPMVGAAGALALRRHQERMEGDVAYARGRQAGRVARKRFSEAAQLSEGTDGRAFYAEVARALRGFIADKLNLAEAGMQRADFRAGLEKAGVEEALVARVEGCLDECDRHRFGPRSAEAQEMRRFLDEASSIMADLDKAVR